MSTAQHTPGPWVLDPEHGGFGNVYCSDATGSIVARTRGKGFHYAPRPMPEVEANARLISAAPEMLAALRAYEYAATLYGDELHKGALKDADAKRRVAIAKAEGK